MGSRPFTCDFCEDGIELCLPSTNKCYCKKHLETKYFKGTKK